MQISLKAELLKAIYTAVKLSSWDERRIKEKLDTEHGFRKEDVIAIDLIEYDMKRLQALHAALVDNNAPTKTHETVNRWIEVLKNPMNGDVTSLQALDKVFKTLMKGLKDKWLFYKKGDGEICPVLITKTKYYAGSREEVANYTISAAFGYLFPTDDDKSVCYSVHDMSFYFYKSLLSEDGENEEEGISFGTDADFTPDDDDDDENEKSKTPKKKKNAVKLAVILEKKGLFIPTKDLYDKYQEQIKKLNSLYSKNGRQFTVNGTALEIDRSRYSYSDKVISMEEDGDKNKVVIDNTVVLKDVQRTKDSELKDKTIPLLPYHPYLKMYDITKYRNAAVHVDRLEDYVYNEKIVDMLILPDSYKQLLNSLIGGENNFADIISGKSGGIIILGSGIAGTGKTLTAEVYSEVVKKPLYQIQSAQLGTKPEEIEENLRKILRRADRWNAVLLIDECDAYVFQRGADMIQNCVVGVFLRLLEYYKGILFLTTNRHDILDGAIKSRLTAHIKYGVPTKPHQIQIFENLSKRFGISISSEQKDEILKLYPRMVGRDIRNLLKLIKKFYYKEKGTIALTAEMVENISEFIPFIEENKPEPEQTFADFILENNLSAKWEAFVKTK